MNVFRDSVRHRLILALSIAAVELLCIVFAFQFQLSLECEATGAMGLCLFLRSLVARAITIFATLALFIWARPKTLLFSSASQSGDTTRMSRWIGLHLIGVFLIFAPFIIMKIQGAQAPLPVLLVFWIPGVTGAATGILFWLAPPGEWLIWLRNERFLPLILTILAFLTPELTIQLQRLWNLDTLAIVTFNTVASTLMILGGAPEVYPEDYVIGMDDFFVEVARQCAGIEGFALITVFTLFYALLFRQETRFPNFWIMLPVGILLSWVFNVLRITILIWLGARVSPQLAVNGFHSFAGWMFFTFLALIMLYAAHTIPWLQAHPQLKAERQAATGPLRSDWTAARILPFIAFMLASVTTSAFFIFPDLAYPIKAAALGVALLFFLPAFRREIEWSVDLPSIIIGVFIGVMWIALKPPTSADDTHLTTALGEMGAAAFVVWCITRIFGTVVLVPIVEELFFRGYLLYRFRDLGAWGPWIGLVLSTVFFAALHGKWLAAGVAGICFGLLMMRRKRISDPIQSHMAANFVVACWALSNNDWGAI